jgi:hypothetical protein
VQHPLSGQFIEVAPKSSASAKASAKTREREQAQKTRAKSAPSTTSGGAIATAKPEEPDLDELVAQRVVETLAKKPLRFDAHALHYIADLESEAWDGGVPDFLLKLFKLPYRRRGQASQTE